MGSRGGISLGSSSNANRCLGGGGSRSRDNCQHGGRRERSKDGGDDKRNWSLSTMRAFICLVEFGAEKCIYFSVDFLPCLAERWWLRWWMLLFANFASLFPLPLFAWRVEPGIDKRVPNYGNH